ncbi:MAG: ATP-binding protein [Gammaproteobacteria bacterium]
MKKSLIDDVGLSNPWLVDSHEIIDLTSYIPRAQSELLLSEEWDDMWLTLIGPRRAGKTTLGKFIASQLIGYKRFNTLLYVNCDYASIRNELTSPKLLVDLVKHFQLVSPIIFIDEAQRLENAGLLLKAIIDLGLPYKLIASGSSQLEIKSNISEYLTGRQFEYTVLPMSVKELASVDDNIKDRVIYGSYPRVIFSKQPQRILSELYRDYIRKDIVEILRVSKPHVIEKLLGLLAHQSGQLVNYQQLATDCQVSLHVLKNCLAILQETYIIKMVRPYVGNKRTEITSNPVIYFIDNGFRNQSLVNFSALEQRTDNGLLVEGYVFQELYKLVTQKRVAYTIHYWRSKSGAEVDFVLATPQGAILPVEVKYQRMDKAKVTRSLRSFLQNYHPEYALVITKDYYGNEIIDETQVIFLPISEMGKVVEKVLEVMIRAC